MKIVAFILVMSLVTYLVRMIPFTLFRKKITSTFLKSILYYLPYAVLSAMTFPYVLYSTSNIYTALAGTVVAIIASLTKRSLTVVAILSCVAVLVTSLII